MKYNTTLTRMISGGNDEVQHYFEPNDIRRQ